MLRAGQYACVHGPGGMWYGQVHTAPKHVGDDYRIRIGGSDEVVTVGWRRVGLHSAYAGRSPRLSPASNAKIDTVLAQADLANDTTCTSVMSGIMNLLGLGIGRELKNFDGRGTDGLYRLVVNFGSDINTDTHDGFGWEHGVVFQKVANDLVFYQGWVNTFSLADWLLLTPKTMCLASAKYAPRHPSFTPQLMVEYFTALSDLPRLWTDLVDKDMAVEIFSMATSYLFGPESPVGILQMNNAKKNKAELRYHWRYTPFRH